MSKQWAMELCRHGLTSHIMQLLYALSETTSLTTSVLSLVKYTVLPTCYKDQVG